MAENVFTLACATVSAQSMWKARNEGQLRLLVCHSSAHRGGAGVFGERLIMNEVITVSVEVLIVT